MELTGKNIGKYFITRLIGEGGMAMVYEAINTNLGSRVAVKALLPSLNANKQIRERFHNEARLMATLNHSNITKVLDLEDLDGHLLIVMEYLEGEDMSSYLEKNHPLNEKEIIHFFKQTLDALQYAHNKGIVHRDIKPSNLFILPDKRVKILDFGIAKLFGQGNDKTQAGSQIGTTVYMSPEQVKGDTSIDYRSDIYSLGVTMYTAVNGVAPYDSVDESKFDILNKIVREPLPELPRFPVLNAMIRKACGKSREQRYQSCDEWIQDLTNGRSPEFVEQRTVHEPEIRGTLPTEIITDNPSNVNLANKKEDWLKIIISFIVFSCTLFGMYAYHNNTSPVERYQENGKYGLKQGFNTLIKAEYDDIYKIESHDVITVRMGEYCKWIDKNGNEKIPGLKCKTCKVYSNEEEFTLAYQKIKNCEQ